MPDETVRLLLERSYYLPGAGANCFRPSAGGVTLTKGGHSAQCAERKNQKRGLRSSPPSKPNILERPLTKLNICRHCRLAIDIAVIAIAVAVAIATAAAAAAFVAPTATVAVAVVVVAAVVIVADCCLCLTLSPPSPL